jgi:hypothetical protein
MRVAAGLLGAVFVLAAALQWNDPDPLRWILAYLVAAALSISAAAGRFLLIPNLLAGVGFGLWFLALAPALPSAETAAFTSFEMRSKSHEEPREAIGLALCAAWSAALAGRAWRSRGER